MPTLARYSIRGALAFIATACVLSCIGCVPYGRFRDDTKNDPSRKSIWVPAERSKYYLAFVEVDDFGELFDRQQLVRAMNLIQRAKHGSPTGNAVVVTFIHGWKNNASDKSGNVWGFRDALNDLAESLARERNYKPELAEPVVGIYIGWRGAVTDFPLIKQFTFYNRRNAAIRIPGAHLTEILSEIIHESKSCINQGSSENNPCPPGSGEGPGTGSLVVIVGHSFGGMVLERSLTQAIVGDILRQEDRRKDAGRRHEQVPPFRPPADLIAMVNEAAPATEAKQLLDLLKHHRVSLEVEGREVPLFLSITSVGDSATGVALPLGQSASKLTKRFRKYERPEPPQIPSQSTYYLHSTAHLPPLFSHMLGREDDPRIQSALTATGQGSSASEKYCTEFMTMTDPKTHKHPRYCIVPAENRYNDTVYWVMQMGKEFVPDHGQIFRPAFRELLGKFVVPRMNPAGAGAKPVEFKYAQ